MVLLLELSDVCHKSFIFRIILWQLMWVSVQDTSRNPRICTYLFTSGQNHINFLGCRLLVDAGSLSVHRQHHFFWRLQRILQVIKNDTIKLPTSRFVVYTYGLRNFYVVVVLLAVHILRYVTPTG